MSNPTPALASSSRGQLITKFADKFGVDKAQVADILKATCFKLPSKRDEPAQAVSNEQLAALLIVADQYGLNPFTREIYAFPDKSKGIVPIVGVDGWVRIMNENPSFDGIDFRWSDKTMQIDSDHKPCPEWCESVIYRKDRSKPIVVREYLEECYRPAFEGQGRNNSTYKVPGPWQSHTKRFLRHKALIQGARIAFGFAGIYDEEEGERIAKARIVTMTDGMAKPIEGEAAPDLEALDNFHRKLAACGLEERDLEALDEFLDATAKQNGSSRNAVKVAASGDKFDEFMAFFGSWYAKQKPKAEEPAKANGAAHTMVECPDKGDEPVDVQSVCGTCEKRQGCPAHEEPGK